jgi:hypothetical protein
MIKHAPQVGGYYVRYPDGYESWSPAKAFEEGYTEAPFALQLDVSKLTEEERERIKAMLAKPLPAEPRLRRVRIVGNGFAAGTKIIDADTGEELRGVQRISFALDAMNEKLCRIEYLAIIKGIDLDTTAELAEVQAPPAEQSAEYPDPAGHPQLPPGLAS